MNVFRTKTSLKNKNKKEIHKGNKKFEKEKGN